MGPLTEEVFIQRTLDIIKQYREAKGQSKEEYYDVTLLFNCLLGLVIMPNEHFQSSMTGKGGDRELSKDMKKTVTATDEKGNQLDIKLIEYIIGLRNGMAHKRLDNKSFFSTNDSNSISLIKIEGTTSSKKHNIEYQFRVDEENQLEKVIKEILDFIYPGKFNF